MTRLAFRQVDVFASQPLAGNPLAVAIAADAVSGETMARFANWTNLSETTFLLAPTDPAADYKVRIFTPFVELPFAGHPTLGSAHVWLAAGGKPKGAEIVQECGAGLLRIRRDGARLAFAAPPLRRSGPVEPALLARIVQGLGLAEGAVHAAQWVDNGPPWIALMLGSKAEVLAVKPDPVALAGLFLGVVAPWSPEVDGPGVQFEVRAFIPGSQVPEDPVTGSLNASLAQWLIGAGLAPERYVVSQGTALGRQGRVHVERIGDDIWIGGEVATCVEGFVNL